MLFSRKKKKRVEPRFENRSHVGADIIVTEDDRLTPHGKPAKSAAKKSRSKARSGPKRLQDTKRKTARARGLIGGVIYWSIILAIWGGVGVAGIFAWYGAQLPSASTWVIPDRPPNVKIVSVNGTLIANRGTTGGEAIGLHDMSPYIPQAVVAIEDRRFFSHFGVDPIGLARAISQNLLAGRLVQGGSTLTQQLAKNLFLSPERTIGRKVQEVVLALWLEQKYSKEEILELYLNRVYFGSGSYGVAAASRRYFGKSARDVSLPEAALLAGLLKAPSRLSPARNPDLAEERAQVVLGAMRAQGVVSDNEMTAALSRQTVRAASYWTGSEHYVADAVMDQLPALIGDINEDVIVDTSVDLVLQKFGEAAIRDLITKNGADMNVSQGALVSIDATGALRAMVGGLDYADSQFNRATEAKRQPGSSFKPFVYLTALEQGMAPGSIVNDVPVTIGKWKPENYNDKYYGEVTLTTALSKSLNSVAAQLIMKTGPASVMETAVRMGITSRIDPNASLALGTSEVTLMELTSAYTPFANGGYRAAPYIIQRVTTMSGKVLYEHKSDPYRAISPEMAGMMNAMMTQTVENGTGRAARFKHPAAGKTGTSQNSRDAWFVGFTANLTTGVWFGNDDGKPMNKVTGGSLPAQAWKAFMVKAHEGVPVIDLPGYTPLINAIPRDRPNDLLVQRPQAPVANGNPLAPDQTTTSSTLRPSADVGQNGGQKRTVMDILLGR